MYSNIYKSIQCIRVYPKANIFNQFYTKYTNTLQLDHMMPVRKSYLGKQTWPTSFRQ